MVRRSRLTAVLAATALLLLAPASAGMAHPPAPADTEPPTPPGKPVATPHSANSLTLSWAAASDNVGVVAYDIYRTRWNGTVELAARKVAPGTGDLSWRFERLLPDFDYQYHVVAVDAAGNESEPSEPLQVRTPADPGSSCQVSFTATGLGAGLVEGMIALTNTGTFAEVWALRFELPGGQQIQYGPLPGWVQDGTEVVAWYEGWADMLGPGERLLPFWATGSVSEPPPTGYVLNGQPCIVQ